MEMSERMTTEGMASNWFRRAGFYMTRWYILHVRRGLRSKAKKSALARRVSRRESRSCVDSRESIVGDKSSSGEACGTWSSLASSGICEAEDNETSVGIAAKWMLAFLSDTFLVPADTTLALLQL